jgi:isoleucyl-tRNA synthetase
MPYAQIHYPFDNREWFEDGHHFPADFIVEYIGQTRAWFYNLHVLSTALFDSVPFKNCMVHGVVLGDDGRKASKRLRNYVDPEEMFETYGADAVRWFLLSSPLLRGQDLVFTRKGVADAVRSVLNPIWNTWYFFTLYANADGYHATPRTDAPGLLDRYVLAKAAELVTAVTERFDRYDLSGSCAAIAGFLDALTNWYVRRSRDRFWAGERDAFDTLATVLAILGRVAAPLLPMIVEDVYCGLTGADSVHLTDWPTPAELPADEQLVTDMDRVREICSAASSVRKAQGAPVRHPLPAVLVAGPGATALRPFADLIADEVNVKDVLLRDEIGDAGAYALALVPAVLGPRVGPEVQQMIKAVKAGDWTRSSDGEVVVAGRTLAPDEYSLRLTPADETTTRSLPGESGVVVLDLTTTPELAAEGIARDVIRHVQEGRKAAGLDVSDRIDLVLGCTPDVQAAVEANAERVRQQVLAVTLSFAPEPAGAFVHRADLDGSPLAIAITRVA